MKLISIGFGSYVSMERIVAALDPSSNPIKRVVSQAKEDRRLVDATYGRKTETVLVMDSGHVILCPLTPETVVGRAARREGGGNDEN